MIRFSAALVVAGLGLLLAGALTSELPLVYAAIAVSVCAALMLAAGVIAGRDEFFGKAAAGAGRGARCRPRSRNARDPRRGGERRCGMGPDGGGERAAGCGGFGRLERGRARLAFGQIPGRRPLGTGGRRACGGRRRRPVRRG